MGMDEAPLSNGTGAEKYTPENRTVTRALILQGSFPKVPRPKPPLTEHADNAPYAPISVVVISIPLGR